MNEKKKEREILLTTLYNYFMTCLGYGSRTVLRSLQPAPQ